MANFERYRLRVKYDGFKGLSGCGFRKRQPPLSELFPTSDEIVLGMRGCLHKVARAASIIYEVPDLRFDVVDANHVLELAVPDSKGQYFAMIVDVLAQDFDGAKRMLNDIEVACRIVRAKHSEVIGITESSKDDTLERLKESMELLAAELRK